MSLLALKNKKKTVCGSHLTKPELPFALVMNRYTILNRRM